MQRFQQKLNQPTVIVILKVKQLTNFNINKTNI